MKSKVLCRFYFLQSTIEHNCAAFLKSCNILIINIVNALLQLLNDSILLKHPNIVKKGSIEALPCCSRPIETSTAKCSSAKHCLELVFSLASLTQTQLHLILFILRITSIAIIQDCSILQLQCFSFNNEITIVFYYDVLVVEIESSSNLVLSKYFSF